MKHSPAILVGLYLGCVSSSLAQTTIFEENFVPDSSGNVYFTASRAFDGNDNLSDTIGATNYGGGGGNLFSNGVAQNGGYSNEPTNSVRVVDPAGFTGADHYFLLNTTSGTPENNSFSGTFYSNRVSVAPNTTYEISFYIAIANRGSLPLFQLNISDNGGLRLSNNRLFSSTDLSGGYLNIASQPISEWREFQTVEFRTSSVASILDLNFYNNQESGGGNDWGFDSLKVVGTAVPEPSGALLLISSWIAICLRRSRR